MNRIFLLSSVTKFAQVYLLCFLFLGLIAFTNKTLAVTRSEVIQKAEEYLNLQWTPNASNISSSLCGGNNTLYSSGTTYTGMPYAFNKWSTIAEFNQGQQTGKMTGYKQLSACNAGVGIDCSGLVSRVWGLSSHYSSTQLFQNAVIDGYALQDINQSQLKKGDIIVKQGHVAIFDYRDSADNLHVIEATTDGWRVRRSNAQWSYFSNNGFKARTFSKLQDDVIILNNVQPSDFDGDGKTDIAVFRPSNASRHILQSTDGFKEVAFGSTSDIPVHGGDYDGDGKADIAVFRPSLGKWFLLQSALGYKEVGFGSQTDIPINAGDFDGDGKTDIAFLRPGTSTRFILQSTDGYKEISFGATSDIPIDGGDYDGDGKADVAVFRPSLGKWFLLQSTLGYKEVSFGSQTDLPINGGDFDGDGKTDIAVFRASNASRHILQSNGGFKEIAFGSTSDIPVHGGDYDGDGKADVAVYRASIGKWFLLQSTLGYKEVGFGSQTDFPI